MYRAKADRKSNRRDGRGAHSAGPKSIAYDTWQDGPKTRGHVRQAVSEVKVTNMQKHGRTGRPIGSEQFIDLLELETGRSLKKKNRT